jgi:hypothetical protein
MAEILQLIIGLPVLPLEVGVAEESITCRSTASVWRDLYLHFPPKPLSLSLSLSYGKIMPDTWPNCDSIIVGARVSMVQYGCFSMEYAMATIAVGFAKKVRPELFARNLNWDKPKHSLD